MGILPLQASGFGGEVHRDFFDYAVDAPPGQPRVGPAPSRLVTAPSVKQLEVFRGVVWTHASHAPRFKARWPTLDRFDSAAFKEFLGLNPFKQVVGIDTVPSNRGPDARSIVRAASCDPDEDGRNEDRFFVQNGQVQLDAYGRALPYDPRVTGQRIGIASRWHAHGATLRTGKKSSSLISSIRRPEQFARPPQPAGSAPEYSQTYAELALIAQLWGGEGSEWLALTYGGHSLHGIEDLGNQIHCTQLGTHKFLIDAAIAYTGTRLKRFGKRRQSLADGGFIAPTSLTPDQVNTAAALIGGRRSSEADPRVLFALGHEPRRPGLVGTVNVIVGSQHRLLEAFVQNQYLTSRDLIRSGRGAEALPEIKHLIAAARKGDAAFEKTCRARLRSAGLATQPAGSTPFAKAIADAMIEASAPEAKACYEAIREISVKSLRRGARFGFDQDPLQFVTAHTTKNKHVRKIWKLSELAWARTVTAIRLWRETFEKETGGVAPGSAEANARIHRAAMRLVDRQLAYLDATALSRAEHLKAQKSKLDVENRGFLGRLRDRFR
ncbi:MAG: hypothetical protein JKY65_06200 [Planctomycetes bacterium]|nr:hypothetical protein [Planctomycetota bacterium]